MRKVTITFGALTRAEYQHTIEVPDDADDKYILTKSDEIYRDLDGGEFVDDPHFWERGVTTWEEGE